MPLCHHFIEAIKMKSIPISNYGHLHEPQILQNDYLKFSDFNSLNEAIINAMNMPREQVLNIQNNLESFYNNKLSPAENISLSSPPVFKYEMNRTYQFPESGLPI